MNKLRSFLRLSTALFLLLFFGLQKSEAQDALVADTIYKDQPNENLHSPHKASLYSMILPGLGQAYNKKYWKIPILYAGIGVTVYAINWNSKSYVKYKNGFRDFSLFYDYKYQSDDLETPIPKPEGNSYEDIYVKGFDYENSSSAFDEWFKTKLQNRKDSYKHDRDLCYIILAGIYLLNIIDATVDAHLSNFNVTDDLTLRVKPTVTHSVFSGNMLGLSCQITF